MAINFPTSPSVNDTHTDGDMSWKWDGSSWEAVFETNIPIPSQSGQSGEYLQTDGTTLSWEPITSATATAVSDQANTSTGYFDLPAGTTAQRPGTPATGMIRFNETDTSLEHYADGTWIGFAGSTPTISSIGPTTAAETGTTIQVTGTNFQAGAIISFIGTNLVSVNASSTTVNSATLITCTTPTLAVAYEPYDVKVTNTNGGSATLSDALDAGGVPAWTTAAGSLGTILHNATGTHFTLVAGDPDSTAVTYTETTSVLTTAGLTLNSTTGAITGDPTDQTEGSPTTYAFDVDASDGVNNTSRSFTITVACPFHGATGGTITTYSDGGVNYKVHTFTADGTFDAGSGGTADVLVVGGGGGGKSYGGGGGGGSVIHLQSKPVTASTYAIVIGSGGAGSAINVSVTSANVGETTTFAGYSATGGGGAGGYENQLGIVGANSGGNGAYIGTSPGAGTAPSDTDAYDTVYGGNTGGAFVSGVNYPSGGGSGAGANGGTPASSASNGGSGGNGVQIDIDGNNYYWGGGGGGSVYEAPGGNGGGGGTGGGGGGADGGTGGAGLNNGGSPSAGVNGVGGAGGANTGGGGGGGNYTGGPFAGGAGGSGIVVIRYIVS